eukprot:GHVH01017231.1.p1 GENE.GHVH01017231.1~~GHVH01017231.1.p1  ORF type:complete len:666 (+),score=62.69 GHVH01017231.1:221-2218(+)
MDLECEDFMAEKEESSRYDDSTSHKGLDQKSVDQGDEDDQNRKIIDAMKIVREEGAGIEDVLGGPMSVDYHHQSSVLPSSASFGGGLGVLNRDDSFQFPQGYFHNHLMQRPGSSASYSNRHAGNMASVGSLGGMPFTRSFLGQVPSNSQLGTASNQPRSYGMIGNMRNSVPSIGNQMVTVGSGAEVLDYQISIGNNIGSLDTIPHSHFQPESSSSCLDGAPIMQRNFGSHPSLMNLSAHSLGSPRNSTMKPPIAPHWGAKWTGLSDVPSYPNFGSMQGLGTFPGIPGVPLNGANSNMSLPELLDNHKIMRHHDLQGEMATTSTGPPLGLESMGPIEVQQQHSSYMQSMRSQKMQYQYQDQQKRQNFGGRSQRIPPSHGNQPEYDPYGERNAEGNVENRYIERNADNRYGERNAERNADNRYTERNADNRYTERNADNRYTERNVDNRYTERNADNRYGERNAERNADNRYTERNADNRYTERNADNRYTERNVDNRYTERNADNRYTERNVDNRYIERNVDNPYGERSADNRYTERNVDNRYIERNAERNTDRNTDNRCQEYPEIHPLKNPKRNWSNNQQSVQLGSFASQLSEMCTDHAGSRKVQQALQCDVRVDRGDRRHLDLDNVDMNTICDDIFGNYVVQKCAEYGNDLQRYQIASIFSSRC